VNETPIDQEDRDRIEETGLAETLFVEAGAGTGKTRELVRRVSRLVIDEGVPLRHIAAITFTEAAGAELRDRIRESFEARLTTDPPQTEAVRRACEAALADGDVAAIGTLHSFALRILSEHPLAAGLPPRVEVLDEVSSQLAFEQRWAGFVDELHDDPVCADLLLQADILRVDIEARGPRSASLKDVAAVFGDNWDRLDGIGEGDPGPLPPVDWSPLERSLEALAAHPEACRAGDDKLLDRIEEVIRPEVTAVLDEPDPYRRLQLIDPDRTRRWKSSGKGRQGNWEEIGATRAACDAVGEAAAAVRQQAVDAVLERLRARLGGFTRRAADERRREGRLEFHDLLVLARRLLRESPEARAALHQRYRRLLLDEFQDTDPIQIEIATLIAAPVDGHEVPSDWTDVPTDEGALFFVGDPKQSIYRFRRADIAMFLTARDAFAEDGPVPLVQNFRTVEPIVAWVNHAFDQIMAEEVPGAQPRYRALRAARTDQPGDHRVVVLGGEIEGAKAAELRRQEATDVADAVARIREEPDEWPVHDRRTATWRAPRMGDVTVLLPTRTSLRQLEDAFDAAGVPYRVDTGTLVYDTQEVGEVLATLRAVDDPTDEIALVTALRSPLYGCSDVDLFTYFDAGGRWDLRRDPPAGLDAGHPVVAGLAHLRGLWRERWWSEPSELMGRLLRERQAFALAFGHRRPREVWRRLRFLVDQARQFQEAGGGGLRSFLDWAELQRNEGSRIHEPLLPETDDDAVSIMTIHGAKGLEFPITVVTGVTTQLRGGRTGMSVVWEGDRPEIKIRKGTATEHFDRLADLEAEMDRYERDRLLYVACTRARDHLVVCTHHASGVESHGAKLAAATADAGDELCRRLPDRAAGPAADEPTPVAPPPADDRDRWVADREALVAPQRSGRFLSATRVAARAVDEEADDGEGSDLEEDSPDDGEHRPFQPRRGRAGTAIGRAVHATLQLVDLATGDHLAELAAQQAHVEAVPELTDTIEAMARSALAAPSVQEAVAGGRLWREIYVAAPVADRAVEGYIDLLYETDQGLVIVDYKTDTVRSEGEIDAKLDRYRLQLAAYALALESSTGLAVSEGRLVFCRPGGPIERPVAGLAAATAEVARLLGTAPEPTADGRMGEDGATTPSAP
jgi:ATP-dependent exoDNAse (exonuclease V) beta subunit